VRVVCKQTIIERIRSLLADCVERGKQADHVVVSRSEMREIEKTGNCEGVTVKDGEVYVDGIAIVQDPSHLTVKA
jgi:hypothetical protein